MRAQLALMNRAVRETEAALSSMVEGVSQQRSADETKRIFAGAAAADHWTSFVGHRTFAKLPVMASAALESPQAAAEALLGAPYPSSFAAADMLLTASCRRRFPACW